MSASAAAIVTKPKPRDRPVSRSLATCKIETKTPLQAPTPSGTSPSGPHAEPNPAGHHQSAATTPVQTLHSQRRPPAKRMAARNALVGFFKGVPTRPGCSSAAGWVQQSSRLPPRAGSKFMKPPKSRLQVGCRALTTSPYLPNSSWRSCGGR